MNLRRTLPPSVAALWLIATVWPANTSAAALVTRCDGEAAGVTIPGDLVVPNGASCELSGSTINGSVTVFRGANLTLLDDTTVNGNVTVRWDGFAELVDSTVAGSVRGRDAYWIVVEGTEVGGGVDVRATSAAPFESALYTLGSVVDGSLVARGSEVLLESSVVVGNVDTRAGVLTDLLDSSLYGTLRVQGNTFGSIVCESEVDGDALFAANSYGLLIGGEGPFGSCEGDSYWGSSVTVRDNNGETIGIDVSHNIVRGSLGGDGNTPAPTGEGNRVRGELSGQFVDLQPAPEADVARAAAPAEAGSPSRVDTGALDARRAVAANASLAAGAAFA